jgi:hypothetical protein
MRMMNDEPSPFLRVTLGTPIYTSDQEKIGTVKERRATAFKVSTPLFQRDFWLPADAVSSATPDESVILAFSSGDLDDYKIEEPAAA